MRSPSSAGIYAGRLRGRTRIQIADEVWFDNRELHEKIRAKAQRLEDARMVSPELRHLHARQLVTIYSRRMQIEQSFRDLKCERFGRAFNYSLTRDPKRIAILLLIHALATFVA